MSNVLHDEIEKFNEHDWWDQDGALKTLHDINPTRFDFILSHEPIKGQRVLDLGCGGGILTEGLAKRGAIATGIDMADEAIAVAKAHAERAQLKIDYQVITAEEHATDHQAHYDVITSLELLEHVPSPSSIIEAAAAMLKPGGGLFLSTINRTLKARTLVVYAAEYLLRVVPKGTHDPDRFITPLELYELCELHGLEVKAISGMSYNPFTRIATLSDDVSMNYLLYATKKV